MADEQKCIFCRIVAGEMPCRKIYEDETVIAFLDVNPAVLGHVLIISKMHYETIFDTDELTMRRLAGAVPKIARNMHNQLKCDITLLQNNGRHAGQIVGHIHFHLIPRKEGDGIHLSHQRTKFEDEEMDQIMKRLYMEK